MQLSKLNPRFYKRMELANVSENATAATDRIAPASTGRSKKGNTVRKGEAIKEGKSISSRVVEINKGTTAQDGEVEARREGKISSVYGSITKM